MVQEFLVEIGSSPLLAERRNSTSRSAHEAEADDIVGILENLDMQGLLDGHVFAAVNMDNIPKFGPEELNVAAVVERQVRLEDNVAKLAANIEQLTPIMQKETSNIHEQSHDKIQSMINDVQSKLEIFSKSVTERLDHLYAMRTAAVTSNTPVNRMDTQSTEADRSINIVVFGVKENRNSLIWRSEVDDILQFVAGNHIDVVDMYRVGRFSPDKMRPVIVKLRTVWDRRIILSGCSKLKSYADRIFIAPDESREVRRQKTFDRLKYRAERDGKTVVIQNDRLIIDGITIYSVAEGFINSRDGS